MASLGRNSIVSTCGCIGSTSSCSSHSPMPLLTFFDSTALDSSVQPPHGVVALIFSFAFLIFVPQPQPALSPSLQHLHLPSHLQSVPQPLLLSLQPHLPSAHLPSAHFSHFSQSALQPSTGISSSFLISSLGLSSSIFTSIGF